MFRSPTSSASPRISKQQVPEGPIHDFTKIIEKTTPEEWQKRAKALQSLVALIPSGSDYYSSPTAVGVNREQHHHQDWYNSPPILRHLAIPLSELIRDPRSTVVKRTCEYATQLFNKCQVDSRYLLKDIMPAIIQVHASTVQVIRTYVQAMVVDAICVVPCKMAMPLWLDRLKHDKSRTVREACCLYLSKSLEEWSNIQTNDNDYLSRDIYHQVGMALLHALRDASPQVRQQAKKGLEVFHSIQPQLLDELVQNSKELLSKDVRIKKWVEKIQAGEVIGDDMSIASRSSRVSVASAPVVFRSSASAGAGGGYHRGDGGGSSSRLSSHRVVPATTRHVTGRTTRGAASPIAEAAVPTTIGVSTKSKPSYGGLGPPQRVVAPTPVASTDSNDSSFGNFTNASAPAAAATTTATTPLKPSSSGGIIFTLPDTPNPPALPQNDSGGAATDQSFDTAETDVSDLQPITSTTELREVAKSRGMNSRRSSLLQDRLMRSSSSFLHSNGGSVNEQQQHDPSGSHYDGDDHVSQTAGSITNNNAEDVIASVLGVAHLSVDEIDTHPNLPEHTKIAHQLLEAHKIHVDQVMEVLKVEMDALKDFELILLEEGPRRPSEEEVLEYFESVGLCLEQRSKAGTILQKRMDRISMGR
jgi:hypothetical protein